VSFNNVFSSTYQNYKILINIIASSETSLGLRYRASGVDNTSSNYRSGYYFVGNVVSQAAGSGNSILATSQELGQMDSNIGSSVEILSFAPNQATYTKTINFSSGWNLLFGTGALTVDNVYDGFTIIIILGCL
jgi:hypothetical protein